MVVGATVGLSSQHQTGRHRSLGRESRSAGTIPIGAKSGGAPPDPRAGEYAGIEYAAFPVCGKYIAPQRNRIANNIPPVSVEPGRTSKGEAHDGTTRRRR